MLRSSSWKSPSNSLPFSADVHGSMAPWLPFFLRLPSLYPETPSKAKWEDMINWWYSAYVYSTSSPPPWSTLFPSSSLWCKPQFWPIGLIHPPSIGLKDSSARSSFALNIITSEEKCTHLFQALFKKNGGASEAQKGLFSKHLKLLSHTKYSCYKVLFETLFPFGRAGFFLL